MASKQHLKRRDWGLAPINRIVDKLYSIAQKLFSMAQKR
jgi:hypothetical protein